MKPIFKKKELRNTLWDLYLAKKRGFFLQYSKLIIKRFLNIFLQFNIQNETFLGYKFKFKNYKYFVPLIQEVFIHSIYKPNLTKKTPFIVDCGGNIGISVIFFKYLYPDAKIIVFEPDRTSFDLLTKNIKSNNLSNVTLINKALSKKKGKIKFYTRPHTALGLSSIIYSQLNNKCTIIDSVLLSDFIKEPVDLLKLDVEGAEEQVIEDLHENNKLQLINELICEYHHNITSQKDRLSHFLNLFEKAGFDYQLSAILRPPLKKRVPQNLLLYFYKNQSNKPIN
tara:strand:+ start:3743 stop:4588 length:846 start_codon:yes stop_codon:yes gene_type:complete